MLNQNSLKHSLMCVLVSVVTLVNAQIETPCNLSNPIANDLDVCGPGSFGLTATSGEGNIHWYSDLSGPSIATGPTFQTPLLSQTTDYFVRSESSYTANWSFDQGLEGWANETSCAGISQDWLAVNDGGVFSIKATDYSFNSSQLILSPVLDATMASNVDFEISHRYNTETCCDHGYVVYRVDNGPWIRFIFDVNAYNIFDFMYNDPILGACGFSPDIDLFAGDSGSYISSSGSASIPSGASTIQFGFLFTTDASFGDDGWYINNALATIHCQSDAVQAAVNILPLNEAPTAMDATLCGPGTAELSAISNSVNPSPQFNWYESVNSDTPLFTGNPFSTSVSEITAFFVEEAPEGGELNELQTFDDGLGLWTAAPTCGLTQNWETVTDQGRTVMKAYSTGGNSSMFLSSQVFSVSNFEDIYFSFKHRYNTETCCDHGYVLYRIDGGIWQQFTPEINTYNIVDFMYNDPILGDCGFSPDINLFAGDSDGYLTSAGLINTSEANTLEVAFLYTSDASFADEGWFIDEVRLLSQEYCPSASTQAVAYVSDQPSEPTAEDVFYCPGSAVIATAISTSGNDPATLNWHDDPIAGNLLHTGSAYEFEPPSDQVIYVSESASNSLNWDFDNGLDGWTAEYSCGTVDLWTPTNDGGQGTIKAIQSGGGNSSMSLISPVISTGVTSSIDFTFNHRFNTETCCDHGYVLYRIDGGDWEMFNPSVNPPEVLDFMYNDPYLGGCGFSPDMLLYAGDSDGYITSSGTIEMGGGENIQFSFFYSSDASFVDDGWYLNSVTVEGMSQADGCSSNRVPVAISEVALVEPIVNVENLCFPGDIFMNAQSGSGFNNTSFNWYNNPNDLIPIQTGNSYSVFTSVTETFYVEEVYPILKSWDFENDIEDWTATSECGFLESWTWVDENGEGALQARQSGGGNSSMLLSSPIIELNTTATVSLSYNHRYNTETCCDHGYVSYRLDGGPWQYFEPTSNGYNITDFMYNDPILGGCGSSPDILVYAGESSGYITSSGQINTSGASTLEVAFLYTSDASFVDEGWFINGVDVNYYSTDCASPRVAAEIVVSHYGCTDPEACNYDPTAGCGTSSCVYNDSACGNCVDNAGQGADFFDYYAPSNWTTDTGVGNGSVTHNIGSLSIVGTNNDGSGQSNVLTETTIVAEISGTYSFFWEYYTDDGPSFDPAYYINGTAIQLTETIGGLQQAGFISFVANAGDEIGFGVNATDGCCGQGMLLVTRFKYPVIQCGCTDFLACNFDPTAVEDSGNCCYSNCVQFEMLDSFGDGWNGATYVITNNETNEIAFEGTMQSGSIQEIDFCFLSGCYSIEVGGGVFDSEISWNIYGADGGTVSGDIGTNYFGIGGISCAGCTDPLACNYSPAAGIENGECCFENCLTLQLFDSFGDGWNGGTYEVTDANTGTIVSTGTMLTGSVDETVLCLPNGCYSITAGGGSFPGEISWTLLDTDQGIVSGSVFDVVPFGVGGSSCFGCTETLACNYNPDVVFDDGSCEFSPCSCLGDFDDSGFINTADLLFLVSDFGCNSSCLADMDGDGIVNTSDLLIFLGLFGNSCD